MDDHADNTPELDDLEPSGRDLRDAERDVRHAAHRAGDDRTSMALNPFATIFAPAFPCAVPGCPGRLFRETFNERLVKLICSECDWSLLLCRLPGASLPPPAKQRVSRPAPAPPAAIAGVELERTRGPLHCFASEPGHYFVIPRRHELVIANRDGRVVRRIKVT